MTLACLHCNNGRITYLADVLKVHVFFVDQEVVIRRNVIVDFALDVLRRQRVEIEVPRDGLQASALFWTQTLTPRYCIPGQREVISVFVIFHVNCGVSRTASKALEVRHDFAALFGVQFILKACCCP